MVYIYIIYIGAYNPRIQILTFDPITSGTRDIQIW